MIDIVIPTLWRHERLAGLVANIHEATVTEHRVLFVAEDHDHETHWTIDQLADPSVSYVLNDRSPNCCGAFNAGHAAVSAPWWFAAGDDLKFWPNWDVPVMKIAKDRNLGAKLIGTRDLHNVNVEAGWTATHFLVNTEYSQTYGLTFDEEPGIVAHEGYGHDFFDTEACHVATTRGVFQPCLESWVEHIHYVFALANVDRTYQRNQDLCKADPEMFAARKAAWDAKYGVAA